MSKTTVPGPVPAHIMASPSWQRIWAKLLTITPEAEAAVAAARLRQSDPSDQSAIPTTSPSVAASGLPAGRHLRASDPGATAPGGALGGDVVVTAGPHR